MPPGLQQDADPSGAGGVSSRSMDPVARDRSQLAILDHLHDRSVARDIPPTLAELAVATKMSVTNARHHLASLRERGYVEWTDGKARTLRITERGSRQRRAMKAR